MKEEIRISERDRRGRSQKKKMMTRYLSGGDAQDDEDESETVEELDHHGFENAEIRIGLRSKSHGSDGEAAKSRNDGSDALNDDVNNGISQTDLVSAKIYSNGDGRIVVSPSGKEENLYVSSIHFVIPAYPTHQAFVSSFLFV